MSWKTPKDNEKEKSIIEDFINKVDSLFDNKNNKNNTNKTKNSIGIWVILVIALTVFFYQGFYILDEREQAVVLRLGKYSKTSDPGLNFYIPIVETKYQFNVTSERTYSNNVTLSGRNQVASINPVRMLTKDENIIEVPLTVQYKISNSKDFLLNVADPEISLQHATDSVVRHVVGSTDMDEVLTQGREVMSTEVHERLQKFMDNYQTGILITQVNLQSATAPSEVTKAFDDVIRAREDEQREKNQAESYSNSLIPKARGLAIRAIEDANAYKDETIARAEGEAKRFELLLEEYTKDPQVTRKRLYLQTMNEVMQKSSKVFLPNQSNGSGTMFYLPIDKIIHNNSNSQDKKYSISNLEQLNRENNYEQNLNLENTLQEAQRESRLLQNQITKRPSRGERR